MRGYRMIQCNTGPRPRQPRREEFGRPGEPASARVPRAQRPWNSAGRFSTNAAMPSFWSAVANAAWNSRRS